MKERRKIDILHRMLQLMHIADYMQPFVDLDLMIQDSTRPYLAMYLEHLLGEFSDEQLQNRVGSVPIYFEYE